VDDAGSVFVVATQVIHAGHVLDVVEVDVAQDHAVGGRHGLKDVELAGGPCDPAESDGFEADVGTGVENATARLNEPGHRSQDVGFPCAGGRYHPGDISVEGVDHNVDPIVNGCHQLLPRGQQQGLLGLEVWRGSLLAFYLGRRDKCDVKDESSEQHQVNIVASHILN
jgi:hypothetical protein